MADVTKVKASDGTIYDINDVNDYTKDETDALLAGKADVGVSYTKAEDDALLADKANASDVISELALKANVVDVYSKTEADNLLAGKADTGVSYTKAEDDALLADKANAADVYTITQADALLADKAGVDDSSTTATMATWSASKLNTEFQGKADAGDSVPVGVILPFGGSTPPTNYLLCDGSEVAIADYTNLYGVIGDAFGTASDSDHFVLPDMRESIPKGAGLTGKTVGAHLDADGLAVGEFLDDRIENITGSGGVIAWWQSGTGAIISTQVSPTGLPSGGSSGASHVVDFDASRIARTGVTTEVKSVGVNYIIKY